MFEISKTTWLLLGVISGYVLMMATNPVRECLRDGWLAVRRYPVLWLMIGVLGFANALFAIATRAYLAAKLPHEEQPSFVWMREAWRDPQLWLTGSPESLWWLPHAEFVAAVRESMLPAFESVAGLFDNLVSSFPASALLAPFILLAWRGYGRVLWQALTRRFGAWGIAIYAAIALAALAAMAKPVLYLAPGLLPPIIWMQWGQVITAAAFIFEYLVGVGGHVFLLLVAYAWVRGLNFAQGAMIEVAIRRFTCVLQWSALVLLLSVVLIEAPLILKNFPSFAQFFPEEKLFASRLTIARGFIAGIVIAACGMQVSLALHSSSWRRAWSEHRKMLARAWWPLTWFFIIAFLHFFLVRALQENVSRGVGEGTALWVTWRLLSPWLYALVAAWLLASWTCFYQRFGRGEGLPLEYVDRP